MGRVLSAALALGLAGGGWLLVSGLFARSELLTAQRQLTALQQSVTRPSAASPGISAAALRSAAAHAARAHQLTTGPAWYLAAQVPFLGRPVSTVRGAAQAADRLTHDVLPPVVQLASRSAGEARTSGLDALLTGLGARVPALDRAARTVADTRTMVTGLPGVPWLPNVERARTRLVTQLDRMTPLVSDAAMAARVAPSMLGAHGPRRYMLVIQNTAESRGTGGLPGAFAVLNLDQGKVRFEAFGTDTMLGETHPAIDLGAEYRMRYGAMDPTGTWANSNVSPHFPYAARIWAAAWREHSGQRLDGAIAVDPNALARFLQATGPARLPDGTSVTAANVLDLTERTAYARFSDSRERKSFLVDVARATATRLVGTLNSSRQLPALLTAVHDVVAQGRLQVWSAHPDEQSVLETRPLAGALPVKPGPFAGLVVNNAAGGKLDFYLDRELHWIPSRCAGDRRSVTARITLTNRAPASGLPPYVTQRVDTPPYPTRPGDNRLIVSYYAGTDARLTSATLDGHRAMVNSGVERGHPVYTVDVELPAQHSRTLTLVLDEPADDRSPTVWRQPLVTPLRARVEPVPACEG
ncbi:DUF4012 domain-containing protein [Streptomyces gilvus]|uniref:DUF4012 domain-containing protein n=1 Tax=Streptomyces gilvus TaxID=2920937 RepID=UPI001F0F6F82|nr:DUF4012 domain-containing protein [Streptomyces sp. CME 23]MCH5671512.1 DUF4012 domain-containing protein [Streptomyces sp. CME 23]